MSDEDPIDDMTSVGMTGAAAVSRAAEVLMRAAQERRARASHEARERTEQMQQQAAAQTELARKFYERAASVDWLTQADAAELTQALRGAHAWADLDPDAFESHAQRMTQNFQTLFGVDVREVARELDNVKGLEQLVDRAVAEVDQSGSQVRAASVTTAVSDLPYDSPESRRGREAAMMVAGVPEAAVRAKASADRLNASDPGRSAQAGGNGTVSKKKAVSRGRRTDRQRGRDG